MANLRPSLHKALPRSDRCKGRLSFLITLLALVLACYGVTIWTLVSVHTENRSASERIDNSKPEQPSARTLQDPRRQLTPLQLRQTATRQHATAHVTGTNETERTRQHALKEENKPLVSEIDTVRVVRSKVARTRSSFLQETSKDMVLPLEETNASPVNPLEQEAREISSSITASPPPLKVLITHETRNDLMGSFVAPTLYLHAIARYYNWTLVVLPFLGSLQHEILKNNWALADKIDEAWGTGFQDANHRKDYNPIDLNARVHDTLGFFPPVADASMRSKDWVRLDEVPSPRVLPQVCQNATKTGECYIWLPDNPHFIQNYMIANGGCDAFFPPDYRQYLRESFLKDKPEPEYFDSGVFNIAIHVRRGDILDPMRWINQTVYASIARHVCRNHQNAAVHVFSSGPNRDGNWSVLEQVTDVCGSVAFHIDDEEFLTWRHMVSADALIMSKSSFSAIPALLSAGEVYFPFDYWHIRLSHFHLFHTYQGDIF